ncbi:MAG: hypothetical protein BZY80_00515, partial [SAR202 cluster bacterium Io17-Chloro-G2]
MAMVSKANRQSASRRFSEAHWKKLGITTLMRSAWAGDLDSCRKVLESGADVNATDEAGWTALMGAAAEGLYDI